jgi:toxin secretion/phage lysis holin
MVRGDVKKLDFVKIKVAQYITSAGVAVASYLYGGFFNLLKVLLTLIAIDIMTGMVASVLEEMDNKGATFWQALKKIKSATMWRGGVRKMLTLLIVAVGHYCDILLGTGSTLRDACTSFYIANELLSIIENCGRAGVPIPERLERVVEVWKTKSNQKGDNK